MTKNKKPSGVSTSQSLGGYKPKSINEGYQPRGYQPQKTQNGHQPKITQTAPASPPNSGSSIQEVVLKIKD